MYLLHSNFIFWALSSFAFTNVFPQMTLETLVSKLIGNTTRKDITVLKQFSIYKLSIYANIWKNDNKDNVLSTTMEIWTYLGGIGRLPLKIRIFYVLIVIASLLFFFSNA